MPGVATIITMRLVTAVLQNAVTGLAHGIATLELMGEDQRPAVPSEILCQADDDIRVREWAATERCKVHVMEDSQGSSADPVAANTWRDSSERIVIAIVARKDAAPKDYLTAKYLEQAVMNTIDRELMAPGKLESAGVQAFFSIEDATSLDSPAIEQDMGVGKVLTATRYGFMTRHHHP